MSNNKIKKPLSLAGAKREIRKLKGYLSHLTGAVHNVVTGVKSMKNAKQIKQFIEKNLKVVSQ